MVHLLRLHNTSDWSTLAGYRLEAKARVRPARGLVSDPGKCYNPRSPNAISWMGHIC